MNQQDNTAPTTVQLCGRMGRGNSSLFFWEDPWDPLCSIEAGLSCSGKMGSGWELPTMFKYKELVNAGFARAVRGAVPW